MATLGNPSTKTSVFIHKCMPIYKKKFPSLDKRSGFKDVQFDGDTMYIYLG